jgi:GR25 family glycosyltransferase involved in LPS biosynthesis
MGSTPILLIGFNRPELLKKRINEIKNMQVQVIYISIDGGSQSHTKEMLDLVSKIPNMFDQSTKIKIIHHKNNIGLTTHISQSISNVLKEHENIIVVEDDIALSPTFYQNIQLGLELLQNMQVNGLVSAFSPINNSGNIFIKNKWRKSIYFPCWGWGCSRETWGKYNVDLSEVDMEYSLKNSESWNKLSPWQKNIWKLRFEKVRKDKNYTWDAQMQFASFANDFTNLAPLFRFIDNEGFNDLRAVHTKGKKPKWLLGSAKNTQKIYIISNKFVSKAFQILDANTYISDTKFIKIRNKLRFFQQ